MGEGVPGLKIGDAVMSSAVGGSASGYDWQPDVIHCNDWPTGLAAAYLQLAHTPRTALVMAVHNLQNG